MLMLKYLEYGGIGPTKRNAAALPFFYERKMTLRNIFRFGHSAISSVKRTHFFFPIREIFIKQIYLHEDIQAQDVLPVYPAVAAVVNR